MPELQAQERRQGMQRMPLYPNVSEFMALAGGPVRNRFFQDAAMSGQQPMQMPGTGGAGLGMMIAMEAVKRNPQLRKLLELEMQKLLVPQQAQTVQRPVVDQSIADLLAMSQMRAR